MKKIICWLFGHRWKQRNRLDRSGYLVLDTYGKCNRCGKDRFSFSEIEEADIYFI